MNNVEDFIYSLEDMQREIALYFHELLCSFPEITAKISYKIPFYYRKSRISYINPLKNGNVELAFVRGNELSNVQGILKIKDRKLIAGIEIQTIKAIPEDQIKEIIQEAILLDDY